MTTRWFTEGLRRLVEDQPPRPKARRYGLSWYIWTGRLIRWRLLIEIHLAQPWLLGLAHMTDVNDDDDPVLWLGIGVASIGIHSQRMMTRAERAAERARTAEALGGEVVRIQDLASSLLDAERRFDDTERFR